MPASSISEKVQIATAKINEVIEKANNKYGAYGVKLENVSIRFDLRGRSAGQAGRIGNKLMIRLNIDMMAGEGWEHVLNETIPHEIAHLVCFSNPALGRNHDKGWKRVCVALGGNGERCHSEKVEYVRGGNWEYVATSGHKVIISGVRHGKIQRGTVYRMKAGGLLNNSCSYRKV